MKPLTLLLKPAAGLCNMNCRYCFYTSASSKRENRITDDKTVDALIQRVKEFQPSALSVMFQGGEPLLCGLDFFERTVKKIKENISCRVSFSLQTNGLLIDGDYARLFKENGFLIGVSLDGDKDTNDRYRLNKDGKSTFSTVLNSVSILKEYGVDFNILSVIDNENAKDIKKTYSFFKENGFSFLQFIPLIDEENGLILSAENYSYFLKELFDLWYDDYIKGEYISIRHIDNYIGILLGNPPENCAMCGVCGKYFVVEANGDIFPCDFYCKDELRLGSVFDDKPFDENEKQKQFIEQSFIIHRECEKCKYYPLCRGGCRRDRVNNLTENKYCSAYKEFFDYALERMVKIAKAL